MARLTPTLRPRPASGLAGRRLLRWRWKTQLAFETRFGIPIVETMGLTETAAQILSNPLPPGLRKIGSPGKAYGNEVVILSDQQEPLGADIEGEIAIRGPNVMLEYYRNPEATQATFTDSGWLRTGDLGKIDTDGYVFVTGRLKELIIKGGENIAPREVDEVLYTHADVVEAAAFARPCTSYGETGRGCGQTAGRGQCRAIRAYCALSGETRQIQMPRRDPYSGRFAERTIGQDPTIKTG